MPMPPLHPVEDDHPHSSDQKTMPSPPFHPCPLADLIARGKRAGFLGFKRKPSQYHPTLRYYEINVDHFRENMTAVFRSYLKFKIQAYGQLNPDQVTNELNAIVPVVINACMAALYPKLCTIHSHYQTYANRCTNNPTYNKDFELPLPLADAIQSFGTFTPSGTKTHYICIPTYPEGILNEGCDIQAWSSPINEGYLPALKMYGIPVKSVDPRIKAGSPWWTFKVLLALLVHGAFDLECIFPGSNYSDHSVMLAIMFVATHQVGHNKQPKMFISHLADDETHVLRARGLPDGTQVQMFAALCHAPAVEWNPYLLLD